MPWNCTLEFNKKCCFNNILIIDLLNCYDIDTFLFTFWRHFFWYPYWSITMKFVLAMTLK